MAAMRNLHLAYGLMTITNGALN